MIDQQVQEDSMRSGNPREDGKNFTAESQLSERDRKILTTELSYRSQKSGVIGGYCEYGFPIYRANREMAAMMGYDSVEELVAAIDGRVSNTIHPDDMAQVMKDIGEEFYEGLTYETIYRMPRKDGSWFWTVDKGKVIRAEDGRLAILSICSDMSDFVHRQKELEEKSLAADYLFENLPGGYHRCAMDDDYTFLYVSPRFLNILGWTEAELREKFDYKFINLLHPDDRAAAPQYVERILRCTTSQYQDEIYRLRGKNGYHWVTDTTLKVTVGGESFFQGFITDITEFISEREQRELELHRSLEMSEQRYEIIAALSKVYREICIVDLRAGTYAAVSAPQSDCAKDGKIGTIPELRQLWLQKNICEEQGKEAAEFLDFSTAEQRLKDREYIAQEFKGRSGIWFLITMIVKNRAPDGTVSRLLLTARDVNEQKKKEMAYRQRLEQTAREAQRASEAKEAFLSRMSHDIRTPLNGIIGLLKIDESHLSDPQILAENHQKMQTAANHLLSLINDVLQMSKLEDGRVELTREVVSMFDLAQDIAAIITERAVEEGITWSYRKQELLVPYVYGSPVHLRQIFLNIYSNCIKYNRPGGQIRTEVEILDKGSRSCTVRWIISDTGIGMSKEFLKHIFDPFAQERVDARSYYNGTGLGMPIVKSLLNQMGGTITITSEKGVGSRFEIEIPFEIAPESQKQEKSVTEETPDLHGIRLLLAEDNELNADIAQILLTDQGASVTVVGDGQQAVEQFAAAAPGTYDAILMDIMMPVMDGLTATRTIRGLRHPEAKRVPIIAMTANAFSEDAQRCYEAGMDAFLAKPLDMGKVISTIAEFCGTGRAALLNHRKVKNDRF